MRALTELEAPLRWKRCPQVAVNSQPSIPGVQSLLLMLQRGEKTLARLRAVLLLKPSPS